MSGFLEAMARSSETRARAAGPIGALLARASETPAPPRLVLQGFDLFAEVKRASPSEGALVPGRSSEHAGFAAAAAARYAAAGAAAVSVLTEPSRFGGGLDDLAAAAAACPAPVMRKDFLVDPVQLVEARLAGAGGALLIARMLDDARLDELLAAAAELGLFVLLEAFDAADLDRCGRALASRRGSDGSGRAGGAHTVLVGLNSRDLTTLAVDPGRLTALADRLPAGVPTVAESGLTTPADVSAVAAHGYAAALIGSALMRAADPAALAADLLSAGRAAKGAPCS